MQATQSPPPSSANKQSRIVRLADPQQNPGSGARVPSDGPEGTGNPQQYSHNRSDGERKAHGQSTIAVDSHTGIRDQDIGRHGQQPSGSRSTNKSQQSNESPLHFPSPASSGYQGYLQPHSLSPQLSTGKGETIGNLVRNKQMPAPAFGDRCGLCVSAPEGDLTLVRYIKIP